MIKQRFYKWDFHEISNILFKKNYMFIGKNIDLTPWGWLENKNIYLKRRFCPFLQK